MITIQRLTHKQKALMEVMWAMDSLESVKSFIQTLPSKQDQADCLSLLEIAVVETQEQEQGLDEYAEAARLAIASASRS